MNQRLSHTIANHSEVQEHLSEANNKVSQACLVSCLSLIQYCLIQHEKHLHERIHLEKHLSDSAQEKAILSTQVLKLEDNVKELKVKLTAALSDKDHLIQVSDIISSGRYLQYLRHLRSECHALVV